MSVPFTGIVSCKWLRVLYFHQSAAKLGNEMPSVPGMWLQTILNMGSSIQDSFLTPPGYTVKACVVKLPERYSAVPSGQRQVTVCDPQLC